MARRKSLLAQMYAARQKAKLERQREEERFRKEQAAEMRKIAAQLEKEAAQQRREGNPVPHASQRLPSTTQKLQPSYGPSRRLRRRSGWQALRSCFGADFIQVNVRSRPSPFSRAFLIGAQDLLVLLRISGHHTRSCRSERLCLMFPELAAEK